MAWIVILAAGAGFVMSAVLTYVVQAVSTNIDFVDRPGGHKQHDRIVALGGGVAIFLAICLPVLTGASVVVFGSRLFEDTFLFGFIKTHAPGIGSKFPTLCGIMGCALLLSIIGLIDDRKPLGPMPKLLVQMVVAIITSWLLGVRLAQFLPAPASIAITVFWIVLITNAFNFLDNMDGLSAGVGVITAAIIAMTGMNAGQVFVPTFAWVLVGALGGFLLYNFSPATIFMGDAGSLVIGFLLSVLTVQTTYYDPGKATMPFGVVVPLVALAVPLYDVMSVVVRRMRNGESPFVGDRRHFSHRLMLRGMGTRSVVITIYLATAATGLPAVLLPRTDWAGGVLILVQCVCVVVLIALLEHRPKVPRG